MSRVYSENSKGFVVPDSLSNTDKLNKLLFGNEAEAFHQLMQSTIDALCKVEPVFIGPDKVSVINDTDTSALVEATNLLSLDVTGSATKHQKYIATIPLRGTAAKGAKIKSFTVYYSVGTAALNSADFSANVKTLATPPTGAAVTLTGTEVLTKDTHQAITMTVDDPEELGSADYMDILLDFETVNTCVLKFYGVVVDYE